MPWEIGEMTPEQIKKHGRPLKNEKDLKEALMAEEFMMPDKLNTEGYKNLGFQCSAHAETHSLNDSFYAAKILCAKPTKFFQCEMVCITQIHESFWVFHYLWI